MPEKKTIERARQDKREGKAPSTQAGEFVKETIEHIRQGKHGARSTKQAISSRPRRRARLRRRTRHAAELAYREGQSGHDKKTNPRQSKAITNALKREGHQTASHVALARQAKAQARQRTAAEKSAIGRKAARTRLAHQTHAERVAIARKAARTRNAHA